MKRILSLILVCMAVSVSAAKQDTLKYRISLTDKHATTYSLDRPGEFLSERAIARRMRQQLPIDSTDLPVCRKYMEAIGVKGVTIVATGKWENFVTVSCNDSTVMDQIGRLPFVKATEKVWKAPPPKKRKNTVKRDSITNIGTEVENWYGAGYQQIHLSNGDQLHEAGFKGEGMIIAIMDAGFHNADRIAAMKNIHILGTKDFVGPKGANMYMQGDHGLKVLSCMAMNAPYIMVGTAPAASYWLLRTEDEYSEHLVEQDYWAAAIEFADSVGVDLVNSSLGYYAFDDKTKNYRYRNLDGRYSLISRQASRAADKGILVVCSAGNAGAGLWKKITPPADAENVLTVGAVVKTGQLALFSSVGNTADNRIKPDVMAVGMLSDVMGTNGQLAYSNGTSFSTPIMCGMVACLWQACPELSAKQIIELVRKSGDNADFPDNIVGYGIPDLWKAYQSVKNKQ